MGKLTLFIPGFFGPDSETISDFKPDVPSLEKLFRFGTSKNIQNAGFIPTLFQLFGFPEYKQDYPVAAVTRLVDDDHDLEGIWMRADPVHLRPERDAVVLLDESAFDLEKHEALILAADLQRVFTSRDIELEAPTNNRWYIKLKHLPEIKSTPIHEVVGNDIHNHLPIGKDKILWDQLSNEAQMNLHQSPLNSEREQRDEWPVNGIWMWGAGELPESPRTFNSNWSSVYADEVTTQGLSILTETPYGDLPDSIEAIINQCGEQDNILVVISFGLRHQQYFNYEGWLDFINYLEEFWFADLLNDLKSGALEELIVITKKRKIIINKRSFYKIWKKRKALCEYI